MGMSTPPSPDVKPATPPPTQIFPSLVRTIVPMIVGWVIAQLAVHGLSLPPGTVEQVVTWLITAAYYGAARVLETRFKPIWGWLLGLPKAPTYQAPAAPSITSPSGSQATVDTPGIPAGAPVDVVADSPDGGVGITPPSADPAAHPDDDGPAPDPVLLQAFLDQTAAEKGLD